MYKWKAVGRILSSAALGSPCKGFGITSSRSSCSIRGISQVSSFPALLNNNNYSYKPLNNMPTRGFFFYSNPFAPRATNPSPVYADSEMFFPSPTSPLKYLYQKMDADDGMDKQPKENKKNTVKYYSYNNREVDSYFGEVPKYPDHLKKAQMISTKQPINVIDLLSMNGRDFLVDKAGYQVPVSTLKGKHVLISAFFLPVLNSSAQVCLAIKQLCSKLLASEADDFEMVMVAKIRGPWNKDGEVVYQHFLSGFPDNCLAIPFSDSESRDYLCKYLRLVGSAQIGTVLIVSPGGEILQFDDNTCSFLTNYGAESFPFNSRHFNDLHKRDELMKLRLGTSLKDESVQRSTWVPGFKLLQQLSLQRSKMSTLVSLTDLLLSDSCTAYKFGNESEQISVSEYFRGKLVGLYLCVDGRFMDKLDEVHQQCIAKDLDIQIVLVCLAVNDDPTSFFNDVKLALKNRCISSWWSVPIEDKICRFLWRISGFPEEDKLIILPPSGDDKYSCVELLGRAVMCHYGGANAYPFTREAIYSKMLSSLKSMTLESLLTFGGAKDCIAWTNVRADRVPLAELRGKKVLLLIDCPLEGRHFFLRLLHWHSDIEAEHPDTKVVIVLHDDPEIPGHRSSIPLEKCRNMPWLMIASTTDCVAVREKLFFKDLCEYPKAALIAFGEDGHILSRKAHLCLSNRDGDKNVASLFNDNLRQEIVEYLADLNKHEY